jgi:hypothetical protein
MMDHCTQTADGLATWIERRAHTPAELRQVLGYALKDAEARGEERGERLASLIAPADPAPEPADYSLAYTPSHPRCCDAWMNGRYISGNVMTFWYECGYCGRKTGSVKVPLSPGRAADEAAMAFAQEHVAAGHAEVEAAPLNAHVGRRAPAVQAGGYFTIDQLDKGRTVG